jgi:hypothetical protein
MKKLLALGFALVLGVVTACASSKSESPTPAQESTQQTTEQAPPAEQAPAAETPAAETPAPAAEQAPAQ